MGQIGLITLPTGVNIEMEEVDGIEQTRKENAKALREGFYFCCYLNQEQNRNTSTIHAAFYHQIKLSFKIIILEMLRGNQLNDFSK